VAPLPHYQHGVPDDSMYGHVIDGEGGAGKQQGGGSRLALSDRPALDDLDARDRLRASQGDGSPARRAHESEVGGTTMESSEKSPGRKRALVPPLPPTPPLGLSYLGPVVV